MQQYKMLLLFLFLNFLALGIGGALMGSGPTGDWYQNLKIAPWTPPGWVFGAAWTTIMLCFSFYMADLVGLEPNNKVKGLFALQWVLNVGWNYVFFNQQMVLTGLVWIILLTVLVTYFFMNYYSTLQAKSWLIAPYVIWLCIATSLNAYIWLNN